MASFDTPLQLGPLLLKNRVIMASLTRNRNLVPGPLQVEYYTQRAGAGLILTEATLIEPLGSEWDDARQSFVHFYHFCNIYIICFQLVSTQTNK
jgi:2,4-dienoyl-CoA reductase-like NADH-dependent reductase (Old Yellow Enzyme family)